MKRNKKTNTAATNRFNIIIGIALVISTVLSVILCCFFDTYFLLNENQLLYLFSAMAQVIGGVFGLTLTAYVFFVDKFKESAREDVTYYDATTALLNRYFHILILIAIICGATVFFSILGIIALHNWNAIYPFLINESVLLFLVGITVILIFGIMLLDPQKLDKEIAVMKKKAEGNLESTSSSGLGDFNKFLKTYNLLENLIIDFAAACAAEKPYSRYTYKPQIIQSLKLLGMNEIINSKLSSEINELRMFRNGLVHGVDFTVSQDICNRISQIYDVLHNAYTVFQDKGRNSFEWNDAIIKVYDLTK